MNTKPAPSPELPDLDRLEALARAATPGAQIDQPDQCDAEASLSIACKPAAVLALIAAARRAQPEGELDDIDLRDPWVVAARKADHLCPSGLSSPDRWRWKAAYMRGQLGKPEGEAPQADAHLAPLPEPMNFVRGYGTAEVLRIQREAYELGKVAKSGIPMTLNLQNLALGLAQQAGFDTAGGFVMPPRPSGHFTNEIVELVRLTAQHAESGAQGISTILSAEMISLWVKGYYRDSRSGGQKSTDVLSRLFRQAYDYGVKSGCAALAAQSQGAQTAQLSIGFANNDQGVHVSVMQQNGDGSATVLHHGRVPAGDSFARFALAARAEAPSLGDGEVARLRRVVRALGMEKDIPTDDATLRGCLFSVLGMIALKLERAQQAAAPGALLAILRDVHDTLASESDSDIDHFEDDDEEREGAPVQYAARKVMEVMDMLKAAPSAPGTPEAPKWRKVTGPGQVEVGARLRFNIGDKQFSERAKLILNAGTDKEEVIYDKGRNFYFITSCVMSGFSNHKNVEYLSPKRAAQLDGGQGEGA